MIASADLGTCTTCDAPAAHLVDGMRLCKSCKGLRTRVVNELDRVGWTLDQAVAMTNKELWYGPETRTPCPGCRYRQSTCLGPKSIAWIRSYGATVATGRPAGSELRPSLDRLLEHVELRWRGEMPRDLDVEVDADRFQLALIDALVAGAKVREDTSGLRRVARLVRKVTEQLIVDLRAAAKAEQDSEIARRFTAAADAMVDEWLRDTLDRIESEPVTETTTLSLLQEPSRGRQTPAAPTLQELEASSFAEWEE